MSVVLEEGIRGFVSAEDTLIADVTTPVPAKGPTPEHRRRVRVWACEGGFKWVRTRVAFGEPVSGTRSVYHTSRGLYAAEGRDLIEYGLVLRGGNMLDALSVDIDGDSSHIGWAESEALRGVARHTSKGARE